MSSPELPVVLIGPILRRVDARSVSVFVALSQAATVELQVYEGLVDAAAPPSPLMTAQAAAVRFGARFFAVVVTATRSAPQPPAAGDSPLMPGHRYAYDLHITLAADSTPHTLGSLGLLKDDHLDGYGGALPASAQVEICALSYADNQLPSFVTPPAALADLVMAHASCRKPHGDGEPALKLLDDVLDGLHGADAGWIHRLFLTGDQIYADDVATALLPGITDLGVMLVSGTGGAIGVEEVPSPLPAGSGGVGMLVNTLVLPTGFRQKAIGSAGFTSEESSSHLIGFGEFLAMYCIAWNPRLWPVLAVADIAAAGIEDDIMPTLVADKTASPTTAPIALAKPAGDGAVVLSPLFDATEDAKAAMDDLRRCFVSSKTQLDKYRREVAKVRRLLANVPTYMIADDHEITDDWFMTGGIRAACTRNPFGRALLRNGLGAYTVCQAWGDDPQAWATQPDRQALLANIAGLFGTGYAGCPPVAAASDAVDRLLGLAPDGKPAFDFSYVLEGPGHRVHVLDTRTRRDYPTPYGSPGLLTAQALDDQLPDKPLPEGDVLVVVSPAPVFGPAVMTELGGVIMAHVA
ncbi:MAG: uncharacterized protein JWQ11_4161, partial [Rhizobacter sp.]|nr:uncharacterized protein [Rhizobacter sp.]